MRLHRHKAATEEMLVPSNRVERGHSGVDQAVIGEYAHSHRSVEDLLDVAVVQALFFEGTIAVGLAHRTSHDSIHILWSEVLGEWRIGLVAFLAEESLLQSLHMLAYRLLCVLLHTRVDGGIDA